MIVKITLHMDSKHSFELTDGRTLEGLNPKEMLLYATADCAGRTIVSLLKEHVVSIIDLFISVEGTLNTPTVVAESRYTHLNIIYNATCHTLKEQIVISRAVSLAHDKYCGLVQMMRKVAPLSHETAIVTTQETNSEEER